MVSKKLTFIVNPNAAMGAVSKEWPRIEALAKDRLGSFQTLPTTAPGDAINLTRQALLEGTEIVVCIGGDGTLNEVVNGFMEEGGPLRRDALLAFIPMGTGCDFIKTVPIPSDANEVFDLILGSCSRAIDLGLLRYRDHHGRPASRYFHNLTSFGLGGEVDERVNRTTKALGGFVSFIWATLISLLIYDKKRVHLTVDNSLDQEVITWNIAVANGQYHGGGMRVAPDAVVDDGLFHITVIGDLSLPQVSCSFSVNEKELEKIYIEKKVPGKVLEIIHSSGQITLTRTWNEDKSCYLSFGDEEVRKYYSALEEKETNFKNRTIEVIHKIIKEARRAEDELIKINTEKEETRRELQDLAPTMNRAKKNHEKNPKDAKLSDNGCGSGLPYLSLSMI